MPIEFRCESCQALLRVPDDYAGRQATCPKCGHVQGVPETPVAPSLTPPTNAGNPFASAGGQTCFGATRDSDNPYQSPQYDDGSAVYDPAYAASRVQGPAISLMVISGLGLAWMALQLVLAVVAVPLMAPQMNQGGAEMVGFMVGRLGGNLLLMLIWGGVLYGAWRMLKLDNYNWAMAAAIISVVPCFSPCCLFGIPFGIWAIVVLRNAHVKAAFRG